MFIEGGTMDLGLGENVHSVTVPSFYIGQFQITQEFFEAVDDGILKSLNKFIDRRVIKRLSDKEYKAIDRIIYERTF